MTPRPFDATEEPAVPIPSRRSLLRVGRIAASAATVAVSVAASAAQPAFPDVPTAPFEERPLPGDVVPHGVVPAEPIEPVPPSVEPVPHDQHASPPVVAPMPEESQHEERLPWRGAPHGAEPSVPFGPSHGDWRRDSLVMPPSSEPGHGPWSVPPHGWGGPIPEASAFPQGMQGEPAPFPGPMTPMRPSAPLAPLPPVEADPTLGPPPGTLGHTYYRSSRYIPHDEHPRVAMADLTLPHELTVDQGPGRKIRVTVHDVAGQLEPLEGYVADDEHWHFESDPLIPGVPHVYRIKVERVSYEKQEIRRYGRLVEQETEVEAELLGVRFLRLIPGRVVTLEF